METESTILSFKQRCEDLLSAKFILADKKISNLLKLIAVDKVLYALTERCLKGFNYDLEFLKAKTAVPSSDRFTLRLPENKEKAAALVFCLLVELDSKTKDLQRFSEEYFFEDGDYVKSYEQFLSVVICPYQQMMIELLKEFNQPQESEKPAPYFSTEFVNFDDKSLKNLAKACEQLLTAIGGEKQLTAAERQEMTVVTEALMHSVLTRDKKLIRALFIGAKNTLKGFKNCVALTKTLEKILTDYWVI